MLVLTNAQIYNTTHCVRFFMLAPGKYNYLVILFIYYTSMTTIRKQIVDTTDTLRH